MLGLPCVPSLSLSSFRPWPTDTWAGTDGASSTAGSRQAAPALAALVLAVGGRSSTTTASKLAQRGPH